MILTTNTIVRTYIIGIDEVGRGPVAGPVVVCACAILEGAEVLSLFPQEKLRDSKKLSEKARNTIREKLQPLVDSSVLVFGIGEVGAARIDEIGISSSIREAMDQALQNVLAQGVSKKSFIFLDGSLRAPKEFDQETVIRGDEKIPSIALASIIAKVHRDAYMKSVAKKYPAYGFDTHVGYGTKTHYEAIQNHGLTELHRKSFLKSIIL